jgi:hypothetical protein
LSTLGSSKLTSRTLLVRVWSGLPRSALRFRAALVCTLSLGGPLSVVPTKRDLRDNPAATHTAERARVHARRGRSSASGTGPRPRCWPAATVLAGVHPKKPPTASALHGLHTGGGGPPESGASRRPNSLTSRSKVVHRAACSVVTPRLDPGCSGARVRGLRTGCHCGTVLCQSHGPTFNMAQSDQ